MRTRSPTIHSIKISEKKLKSDSDRFIQCQLSGLGSDRLRWMQMWSGGLRRVSEPRSLRCDSRHQTKTKRGLARRDVTRPATPTSQSRDADSKISAQILWPRAASANQDSLGAQTLWQRQPVCEWLNDAPIKRDSCSKIGAIAAMSPLARTAGLKNLDSGAAVIQPRRLVCGLRSRDRRSRQMPRNVAPEVENRTAMFPTDCGLDAF